MSTADDIRALIAIVRELIAAAKLGGWEGGRPVILKAEKMLDELEKRAK